MGVRSAFLQKTERREGAAGTRVTGLSAESHPIPRWQMELQARVESVRNLGSPVVLQGKDCSCQSQVKALVCSHPDIENWECVFTFRY